MTILERAVAPTPNFFRKLRLLGMILTAGSGVILGTAPEQLPETVIEIAGYITVAGSVLMAVSQVTVDEGALNASNSDAGG